MKKLIVLLLLLIAPAATAQSQSGGGAGNATQTTITDTVVMQNGAVTPAINVPAQSPQSSESGKTCGISATISGSTFVLISVGDSVISNTAPTPFAPTTNAAVVQNLNLYTGHICRGADPLLGTGGTGASYVTRIADDLITAGKFPRVILGSVAMPGATSLDWSPSGVLNQRARVICWMIRAQGWIGNANVKFGIIWNLGPNDQTAGSTTQQIQDRYNAFHQSMIGYGCNFDTFVAVDSRLSGVTSSTVTTAQANVVDNISTFAGVNIDTITAVGANTSDGTHLNDTGNPVAGTQWSTSFQAHY